TQATEKLIRSEKELQAIAKGIAVARDRRIAAIHLEYATGATKLRREAAEKLKQRDRIVEKVVPLLEAISKVEGVTYDRSIVLHQRCGPWLKNLTCTLPASYEMEDRGIGEVFADIGVGCAYAIPASKRLLDESIASERRAEEIDRRTVNMRGSLRGGTVTEWIGQSF